MKNFVKVFALFLCTAFTFTSCEEDDGIENVILTEQPSPSNLDATIEVLAGNPRAINVTPSADGVTSYNIFFGEREGEVPVSIGIATTATYIYQNPGTYVVQIQGVAPNNVTNSIFFSVEIEE